MHHQYGLFVLAGFIAACAALPPPAYAGGQRQSELLYQQAVQLQLHQHPIWLRLLHIDGDGQSSIISTDFFLAADRATEIDPQSELHATLRHLLDKDRGICDYPARYTWLNRHLQLPATLDLSACENFAKWASVGDLKSVSLISVSSYLGNPASTFGHVLIKFNDSTGKGKNDLFDVTVNFSARVPENESAFLYIFNGLSGAYSAGFSDRYYYTEDLVYSNSEQRDMWEYELNLSEYQMLMLVGHLWELLHQRYQYYFLKQNCGYRIAAIMEMVLEQDLIPDYQVWYAPVSLFTSLNRQVTDSGEPLVKRVQFLPSPQRQLFTRYNDLSARQKQAFNTLALGSDKPAEVLGGLRLSQAESIEVLDSLLQYSNYKLSQAQEDGRELLRTRRQSYLRARFAYPAQNGAEVFTSKAIAAPAEGTPPLRLRLQAVEREQRQSAIKLAVAPFFYDALGRHGQDGSELIVMNLEAEYLRADDRLSLARLDLLRIQKLDLTTPAIKGENNLSWRAFAHFARPEGCASCLHFNTGGGIGRAWRLGEEGFAYFMTDLRYDADIAEARLVPSLTLARSSSAHGLMLTLEHHYIPERDGNETYIGAEYRHRIGRERELVFNIEHQRQTRVSLAFAYYF